MTHPELEELLRFAGDELPPRERAGLAAHLAACPECGLEVARLRAAVGGSAPAGPGVLPGAVLEGIRRWEARRFDSPQSDAMVKRRVAREIEPFLGREAVSGMLHAVSDSGDDLLSTVEPVLGLFLGKRAASNLINRVVEVAIVRI